jgi:hypothetical protein
LAVIIAELVALVALYAMEALPKIGIADRAEAELEVDVPLKGFPGASPLNKDAMNKSWPVPYDSFGGGDQDILSYDGERNQCRQ